MGPIFARIRENMDNRQEARQERREERQERRSTKHDIPTDTPLAEEKILNTDRTEIHKLIADAVKIQLSEKTASKLETEQSARRERLANVSALDYVVDGKVVRPTLVQQEENPNRVLSDGPPSYRVEHTEQMSAAREQPFAPQKEPPKMLEIIKTEKAIFDERLKEMEQKMAALEKKLNEENKKLTVINHSLLQENIDLKIRLNALEQPAASIPATNTPALVNEVNKATEKQKEQTMYRQNQKMADNKAAELEAASIAASIAASQKELIAKIKGTGEIDWNKLGKGYEEFIAGGMKVTPGYSPPWRPASYFANNANLKQDSNSEVFKKFFENAQKISGSKLAMDSPDGLTWIKKIIDVESQTIYPVKNLDRPKNMQISEE